MAKQLIVEIDKEGNIKYQTQGFVGNLCLKTGNAFKAFMSGLGVKIEAENTVPTQEMYENPIGNGKVRQ